MLHFGLKFNGLPVGGEVEWDQKPRTASGGEKRLEKNLQKEIKFLQIVI